MALGKVGWRLGKCEIWQFAKLVRALAEKPLWIGTTVQTLILGWARKLPHRIPGTGGEALIVNAVVKSTT